MFTRLGCAGRPPHFVVEFYPYAGLVQTIRLRGDVVYVRFSDLLTGAPARILEAAAALLLARIYRRRVPLELQHAYRDYSMAQPTRRRADRLRRRRARRVTLPPSGACHNLDPLFDQLNQRYFAGALRRPHIGWSARPWRKQLGCYDYALNQIVLSSRLDRPAVPRYVVEYVLYHEMLHVKHPVRRVRRAPAPAARLASARGEPARQASAGGSEPAPLASEISNFKSQMPLAASASEISNLKSLMPSRAPSRLPRGENARCGLQIHSPAFRAAERRFAHFAAARRWLLRHG